MVDYLMYTLGCMVAAATRNSGTRGGHCCGICYRSGT
uniref:Transcription initiation factor TFIID subunit n=1 Tax=Rhizophora mucronata TaxID=61149 RepID=A0A2P2KNP9_RHIMU